MGFKRPRVRISALGPKKTTTFERKLSFSFVLSLFTVLSSLKTVVSEKREKKRFSAPHRCTQVRCCGGCEVTYSFFHRGRLAPVFCVFGWENLFVVVLFHIGCRIMGNCSCVSCLGRRDAYGTIGIMENTGKRSGATQTAGEKILHNILGGIDESKYENPTQDPVPGDGENAGRRGRYL